MADPLEALGSAAPATHADVFSESDHVSLR